MPLLDTWLSFFLCCCCCCRQDPDYGIVKLYSLSPVDKSVGGRLLVLKPIKPSSYALKVSVTRPQAESIMSVLRVCARLLLACST